MSRASRVSVGWLLALAAAVGCSDNGAAPEDRDLCLDVTPARISEYTGWQRVGGEFTGEPGRCVFAIPDGVVNVSTGGLEDYQAVFDRLEPNPRLGDFELQPAGNRGPFAEPGRSWSVATTGTEFVVVELVWEDPTHREFYPGMETLAVQIAQLLAPDQLPKDTPPSTDELDGYEAVLRAWTGDEFDMCLQTAFSDDENMSVELTYARPIFADSRHSGTEPVGWNWDGRVLFGERMDTNNRCNDLLRDEQPQLRSTWPITAGVITFDVALPGPDGQPADCHSVSFTLADAQAKRPDTGELVSVPPIEFDGIMPFHGIDGCFAFPLPDKGDGTG